MLVSTGIVNGAVRKLGSPQPEHLVLTWQQDPRTTQSFTWRTSPDVTASIVELIPTSAYIGFPDANAQVIVGTSFLFATDIGTMAVHEAEATGLMPGTAYTYRVGDGHADRWSEPMQFRTEAAYEEPFTFLFTSDTQAYPNASERNGYGIWRDIFSKGLATFPDARFMLLSGDIVDYGDQQQQWELWFDAAKELLPNIPLVPTVGNHDVVRTGEENFRAQFQLPRNGPEGEEELVYSFDYGNMHMAVLNSEGDLEKQAVWLREDMKRSDKQWKIVAFHRSPYHGHQTRASLDVRQAWTPIFDEAGIDLVLTGHDHAYMRSWPLKGGEIVEDGEGTTYVIGGTAGSKFYDMGDFPWIRVAYDKNVQMFSGITIDGDRLSMQAVTRDGEIADAFTMIKHGGTVQDFLDIPVSHWAYDTIVSLKNQGIIKGVSDTHFVPNRTVSRAEFVSLIVRALDIPILYGADVFRDVRPGDWYYHEVNTVAHMGIVNGVSEDRFAPDRHITREEMAMITVRAYESVSEAPMPSRDLLAAYSDRMEVSGWSYSAVNQALAAGLLNGLPGPRFAPLQHASRAEAAQVVARLSEGRQSGR